jgi:hypothetical protein
MLGLDMELGYTRLDMHLKTLQANKECSFKALYILLRSLGEDDQTDSDLRIY